MKDGLFRLLSVDIVTQTVSLPEDPINVQMGSMIRVSSGLAWILSIFFLPTPTSPS